MFTIMKKEHVLPCVSLQLENIIYFLDISQLLHFSSVQYLQRDTFYGYHAPYTWERIPPKFPITKRRKNETKIRSGQSTS